MSSKLITIDERDYLIAQSSDVIDAPSKTGTKYWQGHVVVDNDHRWYTCTSSWSTTKKGLSKVMWSTPYYAEEKNVGRANETTNHEQAYSEYYSMVQKEMDKRKADKPLPMLAQTFRDRLNPKKGREKHIVYPCVVQPKYDGMRVLYDGTTAWSRGNKDIIPEVFAHLQFDTGGYIIDGELLPPGGVKVNEVMKAAKKYREGISDKLQFVAYDIVDTTGTMTYAIRLRKLADIVRASGNPMVLLVQSEIASNADRVMVWHEHFVGQGFEGTMIRNIESFYSAGQRVNDLQKFKDFEDEEFEIVDIYPAGGGSSEKVAKIKCITEEGNDFESTLMGSEEYREDVLTKKHLYIGKFAKVKYRERSGVKNVPFHSNVLEIRSTRNEGY